VAEGVRLAVDAVRAGIDNDLGSGSQVDVCVIGQGGTYYRRAVAREEELRWTTTSGGDHDDAAADVTFGGAGDGIDGDKSRISKRGKGIGVNGFGNVPFAIRSRRVVRGGRSDLDAERERRRWLDEVLSLE
jgi:20S proteasome subunit beta 2